MTLSIPAPYHSEHPRKFATRLGRSQRDTVPLEAHAELVADAERADPLAILAQQDSSRLPELIPLRYRRPTATRRTLKLTGPVWINVLPWASITMASTV